MLLTVLELLGIIIWWLPLYLPQTNPIEIEWDGVQSKMRSNWLRSSSRYDPVAAAEVALDDYYGRDSPSLHGHCGYWIYDKRPLFLKWYYCVCVPINTENQRDKYGKKGSHVFCPNCHWSAAITNGSRLHGLKKLSLLKAIKLLYKFYQDRTAE